MIFITLGSQKFPFNRLLNAVDTLLDNKSLNDEVFAQIGYSDYVPENFKFTKFLDRNEYSKVMDKADIVITHGGTGAIMGALKKEKKVIAVPRLAKYGEHVDNHQLQILNEFKEMNLILVCNNLDKLNNDIKKIKKMTFNKYQSNTDMILKSIDRFINANFK